MWNGWRNLFGGKSCYLCGGKAVKAQSYYNDKGNKILVCHTCSSYAERRALVKVK